MPTILNIGGQTETIPFIYESSADVLAIFGGEVRMVSVGPSSSSVTATAAGVSTLTATWSARVEKTALAAGSGSMSATPVGVRTGTASMAGSSTLTADILGSASRTVSMAGSGAMTAIGAALVARSAQMDGAATLSAIGLGSGQASATASGSSTLSAIGYADAVASMGADGFGTMSAVGSAAAVATATAAGVGSLSAVGSNAAPVLALDSITFTAGDPNELDVTYSYSGGDTVTLRGVTSTSATPPSKAQITAGTGTGSLEEFSGTVTGGSVTIEDAFTSASYTATYIHAYLTDGTDESDIVSDGDGSLLGITDVVSRTVTAAGTGTLSAIGTGNTAGTATMAGAGALSAVGSAAIQATATAAGVGALSAVGSDAAAGGVDNPTDILGASAVSWWQADTDVFSDAGTTAAVADGVVQQITDQAGGAALTSAGVLRPTLRESGGYSFIDMDQAYLSKALSLSGTWYICAAIDYLDTTTDTVIHTITLRGSGAFWLGHWGGITHLGYGAPPVRLQSEHSDAGGSAIVTPGSTLMVVEAWSTGTTLGICVNGGTDFTYTASSAASATSNVDFGRANDGGGWPTDNGTDYWASGACVADALPSSGDRADLRTWAASLNGVTL